jgi:hypothetical protein
MKKKLGFGYWIGLIYFFIATRIAIGVLNGSFYEILAYSICLLAVIVMDLLYCKEQKKKIGEKVDAE